MFMLWVLLRMGFCTRKESQANVSDAEKGASGNATGADVQVAESWSLQKFASLGVETGGIVPIPPKERTNARVHGIFTLWLTMSVNLLPYAHHLPNWNEH